jgi:uncharacterized iron-regulated protein
MQRRALVLTPLAALAACATAAGPTVRLLGEVHDNAAGHAWRRDHLAALLDAGARPALALEMLDRTDQPALDAERPRHASAATLVPAVLAARPGGAPAGGGGWHWPFYEPLIDLALAHGLPIVAANVGRDEARRVIREGLAATGFDAAVPEDILAEQARLIEASHCGQVGGELARRMALAQVARDQQMARAVEAHATRGVVLLAGNGHVRTDIGVPRWLSPATRARCLALGVLEQGDETTAFDRRVFVPPQPRADPCAGMTRGG